MKNPITSYIQRIALKALSEPGNQLFEQMFRWINTDMPIWLSSQQDYIDKGYAHNDLIYSIIKTKADAAKSIDWLAYKVVDEKAFRQYKSLTNQGYTIEKTAHLKKKALEEVNSGDAYKLIQEPNKYQTLNDVVEEYFSWIDLMGNFYLYGMPSARQGRFQSIHVAPSHWVEIIAGTLFEPVGGYRIKNWFNERINPAEILHLKNWNPDHDTDGRQLYGMSPMKAAARLLTLDNAGVDSAATTYKNQGVRGIIHRASGSDNMNFTPEQAAAIKEKLESDYSNPDKAGGLTATNAPVGYTRIGESPVDMGVLQSMQNNLIRLCNVFQVPVELFTPGSTFNNKAEARKNMITTGILPRMNIFRDRINRWLIKPYDQKWYIDYDIMSITELQDDLGKMVDMYSKMNWVTDNEKRTATNYDNYPHPLADTLFVDPNRIPIDMAMYDTTIPADIEEQLKRMKA